MNIINLQVFFAQNCMLIEKQYAEPRKTGCVKYFYDEKSTYFVWYGWKIVHFCLAFKIDCSSEHVSSALTRINCCRIYAWSIAACTSGSRVTYGWRIRTATSASALALHSYCAVSSFWNKSLALFAKSVLLLLSPLKRPYWIVDRL